MHRQTALMVILLSSAVGAQTAIGIARSADLSFGQIVAGSSPGTVTITPAGDRLTSGGVLLASGLAVSPARFIVTGDPLKAYVITLPGPQTLSDGASSSMQLTDFTSSPSGSGQLDASGSQTLSVGATLHVAAGQPYGSYSGTFSVLVQYQ